MEIQQQILTDDIYDIQFVFVTFSINPSNTSCATASSRSGLDRNPKEKPFEEDRSFTCGGVLGEAQELFSGYHLFQKRCGGSWCKSWTKSRGFKVITQALCGWSHPASLEDQQMATCLGNPASYGALWHMTSQLLKGPPWFRPIKSIQIKQLVRKRRSFRSRNAGPQVFTADCKRDLGSGAQVCSWTSCLWLSYVGVVRDRVFSGWLGSLDWLQRHNMLYGTELAETEEISDLTCGCWQSYN